uniref:M20/M25/M40 family metallo-hydrolase n=1 Tax=Gelidibacter sp. TaxID=2018083 RepID=UPI00404AE3D3
MKRLFVTLLIFISLFGCKSSITSTSTSTTTTTSENTSNTEVVSSKPVTAAELENIVTYLASDELLGRNTGTDGIEASALFIEKELKNYGIKPYYETYRDDFVAKGKPAYNIVGFIEGTDAKLKNEIVIIGAHYDHIGFGKKVENDSIANGANDNATGTSAVLAIAKHIAAAKSNKRSVIVALFSAEEMGLLGSKHLAEKLKSETIDLYTVVNIEMIGVPFTDRDYDAFLTGYDNSNMAAKINEYVGYKLIGFSEVSKKYNLFKASDNYPFYEAFKLPSHTVSSCDLSNYDHYHQVGDESNKQNYEHMASLVNKLIPAVEAICNTSTKEIKMNDE